MLNNYPFKPRGIIKWHAFAALISGDEQKESAREEKIIDIDLFEDSLEILNNTLYDALTNNSQLKIKYLDENKIRSIQTKIIKIDDSNNKIICSDITISIYNIIDLTII